MGEKGGRGFLGRGERKREGAQSCAAGPPRGFVELPWGPRDAGINGEEGEEEEKAVKGEEGEEGEKKEEEEEEEAGTGPPHFSAVFSPQLQVRRGCAEPAAPWGPPESPRPPPETPQPAREAAEESQKNKNQKANPQR